MGDCVGLIREQEIDEFVDETFGKKVGTENVSIT